MSEVSIFSLEPVRNDKVVLELATKYRTYMTVRRNLREAFKICEYALAVEKQIAASKEISQETANTIFLPAGALMHALVLYARWFKPVGGEPVLDADTFFPKGSYDRQVHNMLMVAFDKYMHHDDLANLGVDHVWVHFNADSSFQSTTGTWGLARFLAVDDLDIGLLKNCVQCVHSYIDATILRDEQRNLEAQLRRLYPAK